MRSEYETPTFLPADVLPLLLLPAFANAQGTPADYERAAGLREKFQGLVAMRPIAPTGSRSPADSGIARRSRAVTSSSWLTQTRAKKPAFDHEKSPPRSLNLSHRRRGDHRVEVAFQRNHFRRRRTGDRGQRQRVALALRSGSLQVQESDAGVRTLRRAQAARQNAQRHSGAALQLSAICRREGFALTAWEHG